MFDSYSDSFSESSVNVEVGLKHKYPYVTVDIKEFSIKKTVDIPELDFLLSKKLSQITINRNVKFVIHEDIVGLITHGKFQIWYHSPEKGYETYLKIVMFEKLD